MYIWITKLLITNIETTPHRMSHLLHQTLWDDACIATFQLVQHRQTANNHAGWNVLLQRTVIRAFGCLLFCIVDWLWTAFMESPEGATVLNNLDQSMGHGMEFSVCVPGITVLTSWKTQRPAGACLIIRQNVENQRQGEGMRSVVEPNNPCSFSLFERRLFCFELDVELCCSCFIN